MSQLVFAAPPPVVVPIHGTDQGFPVRRVYCIGRNYAAHTVEMGGDPDREEPFFFQKNPDNLDLSGVFPYPDQTQDVHHEVELFVALSAGGTSIPQDQALSCVFGYGVALDMTRRDLQSVAKKTGRPWATGKAFERSAPVGPIHPASHVGHLDHGAIRLSVNDTLRQSGDLGQMIWKVSEMVSYLSDYFELAPGDVILTGTPSGVGPVLPGDKLEACIEGLDDLRVDVV